MSAAPAPAVVVVPAEGGQVEAADLALAQAAAADGGSGAWAAWLGADRLELLQATVVAWGLKLLGALVLMLLGLWAARLVSGGVRRAMVRAGQDAVLVDFIRNLVHGALLVVLFVAVLAQVGVPTTSMLAALGAAGLAIGLALKDSLANLAAGVLLIGFRPFRAGDYVEVAGQGGSVVSVRLFFTLLATPDNKEVTIPNNQITTNPIVNYSARDTRRLELLVGIAYAADAQQAMQVIRDVLAAEPRVLPEPPPMLLITSLAESSVDIAVRPWVKTADYWAAYGDLLRDIKKGLETAGIEIPFPQRTVHVIGGGNAPREAIAAAAD